MRIETKDGQLAAEYTDGWVFHSEELEERYDGLEVYGFVGAPKVDGVDIIEIGGELPEDDYRFAYDLAGDDYVVSLNGSVEKGGAGSGHHGHAGRTGSVGGSSALPGYVARTTAMKELGVKHASRMNQYFKYGMPSTSVGGRRYVKWPEAKEWMNSYAGAGKGTRGIEAANTAMRSRGIPVGKHPPLPPPPPPSKPVTGRYAMDQLGIKHYSRLHAYKKHGMPTMKDPKTGKEVIKWPEAKLWYETYDKAGKGKFGIAAANAAVHGAGAAVPKPPAPPKPPEPTPETPTTGEGKYDGVKVYVASKEKISDVDHIETMGFGPTEAGTTTDLNRIVDPAIKRLPQEHVDSVRSIETQTVSQADREYGAGWGSNVAGWMQRSGRMGLMHTDTGVRRWDKKAVVHEVGHGVFTSMMSFMGGRTKRQESARRFLGTPDDRKGKRNRINKEYKRAKAGKKGAGFVTGYSRKNYEEFFCESYTYYVTRPGRLYATNKSMYNFLKSDVFGGMEYSDFRFDSTVK